MITPVVMPQMGLEVTEGTVVTVAVVSGQSVSAGEVLVEIETDKALTEVTAPRDGTVAAVAVSQGDVVSLGAVLVTLSDGETVAAPQATGADHGSLQRSAQTDEVPAAAARAPAAHGRNGYGRLRIAPVARRAATRLGVSLETVTGTGPSGRITLADVERASVGEPGAAPAAEPGAAPAAEPTPPNGFVELVPLSGTRRAIARRMTASQVIPQFSLEREIDAAWLLASKDALSAPAPGAVRPSLNDMLVQAVGELVLRHPALATSYVTEGAPEPCIGRRDGADIGLAVAADRGLAVPVIRRVHERTLTEVAAERVRLVGEARSGRLRADDMQGAAVTISNLGAFGIDRFVAMLNPGEAAILAVGRVLERVRREGRGFALVPTLALTLTIDHRVIDGARGAEAMGELCSLLEGAMTWRT